MCKSLNGVVATLCGLLLAIMVPATGAHADDQLVTPTGIYLDTPVGKKAQGEIVATGAGKKAVTYTLSIAPLHGTVQMADPQSGQWVYTPNNRRIGPDRFEIMATAGKTEARTKIVVLAHAAPTRKTWFVDALTGKDSNDGSSEAAAFATIKAAHDVTGPGDTVLIKNGIYGQSSGEAVVHIKRSGAPGAKIIYKAFPGHKPVLTATTAWNHVLITASFIRVEGLTVKGNAPSISLADSYSVYDRFIVPEKRTWGPETSFVNTNGIFVRPENSNAALFERIAPRHIEIIGNSVSEVPGGGIATDMADYITIAFNTVHDTAYRSVLPIAAYRFSIPLIPIPITPVTKTSSATISPIPTGLR